jgi:hypothetical protein
MLLQNVAGNGGAKGGPPYEVGGRIIVLNKDGTLPVAGAHLWPPPPGVEPKKKTTAEKTTAEKTTKKKTALLSVGQQTLTGYFAATKAPPAW